MWSDFKRSRWWDHIWKRASHTCLRPKCFFCTDPGLPRCFQIIIVPFSTHKPFSYMFFLYLIEICLMRRCRSTHRWARWIVSRWIAVDPNWPGLFRIATIFLKTWYQFFIHQYKKASPVYKYNQRWRRLAISSVWRKLTYLHSHAPSMCILALSSQVMVMSQKHCAKMFTPTL